MNEKFLWKRVNQELVAKTIGELTFEQILAPTKALASWELKLGEELTYTFDAWMTIWEYLRVDSKTLKRNGHDVESASQFFLDIQTQTGMDDIILGNFFEEMHNTLFSDMTILKNASQYKVSELALWNGEEIQSILNGHPKILLNKGRVGWGSDALEMYSPESRKSFQLHWIAVKKDLLAGLLPTESILDESFGAEAKEFFLLKVKTLIKDFSEFVFMPVHPWQWDRFISIQFRGLLAEEKIISLGLAGDYYLPQISIRTLSNESRPSKKDIKLPLTILNTSCIRGLPHNSIAVGPQVSEILSSIAEDDPFLKQSGTKILREAAGIALLHPEYQKITDAPYRYHEYLGSVWRESAQSKVGLNEKAIISASLFHQDKTGASLLGEYVRRSGLSFEAWLKEYFKVIVLPLYHLQLEYGVGMVAHGQNVILMMKDFVPSGMILKDFQGDLRLSEELPKKGLEKFNEVKSSLTILPSHYLIHDLITGNFITVLRFISAVAQESEQLSEKNFYGTLSEVIQEYVHGRNIPETQNILAKTFPRVLLNKVRFSIGYSDSSARPLPMVGSALLNPLCPENR
jgi:aerobactin synthase